MTLPIPNLEEFLEEIFGFSFTISFLIAIYIYSETSIDSIERVRYQVILWGTLFIVLLVLCFLQFSLLIKGQINDQTLINIGLLVIGVAFNMTTIADKGRIFYSQYKDFVEEQTQYLIEMNNRYSFGHVAELIRKQKDDVAITIHNMKDFWKQGERKRFFSYLGLFFLPIIIVLINFKYSDSINYLVSNYTSTLMSRLYEFWLAIFNGNEHVAFVALSLLLVSCGLIWSIKEIILKFSAIDLKLKNVFVIRLIFFLIIFLVLISMLLEGLKNFIVYIVFPLLSLLAVLTLLSKFLENR